MVDDISKLYEKILEEQNKNEIVAPIQKKHLIEENESQIGDSNEEPFDNFLLKLGETIAEHLDLPQDVVDDSGNSYDGVPLEKQTTKSSYIEELKKMDKGDKSKLLPKENNISATISEQVREEIGKVKTQISRMAIEGGGGSVAVQYAKGGTMNGDLNVTGKYLSGGIDLATLIGTGGGGGLSGTTDRLISGSEMVKLNPDGTINFPNNTITPQDETILTLEATKVLDNYYNRLALSPYGFFASDHNGNSITINSVDNEILIDSNDTYYWKFNNQGALEGPFGTLSVSGNLSATGRVYQNGNDLQSEIESLSAISISTKTTVQSNSASWNYQGTDLKNLSAGWVGGNSAYTTVQTYSASWATDSTTDTGVRALTSNWQNTSSVVQANSASWATDSTTDTGVRALTSNWQNTYTTVGSNSADWSNHVDTGVRALTGNWSSSYTTVNTNSATNWNYQGTDLKNLSANWQSTYTTFHNVSSTFLTTETDSQTLSFNEVTKNLSISNGNTVSLSALVDATSTDTGVRSLTSNWQNTYTNVSTNSADWKSVYTTVNTNSATTWDYQGTDLKNLSGNWENTYSTVQANSASWAVDSTIDTGVRSLTSNWESTYTTVGSNSADWGNHVDVGVRSLTGNWSSSYTTVNSNSASWDYQGTDLKSLSSGWVGGNNAYTNLIANSAAYLSSVDLSFLSISANWNSVYSSVTNTSANWDSTYSTVQANSASWAVDSTIDTGVRSLTSNWQNTYTTVGSNSASWDYQGSDIKALTGNWQEAYTNLVSNSAAYLSSVDLSFLSVSTNWDSVYTTVLNESASWIGGGGLTGEYLPLSGGTMTGPISFTYPYGSRLDQGIYDSSRGGLSGISLVCSVNYDFNWQAGWITALEQDRLTPRPLYIDSGAGTSLRVWDGRNYPTSGIEISHSQITFADNTTQITAFTGNTLTFDEITKELIISNGNTVSLSALVDASGIDTGVRLLTSNWESTFTTVLSNSADWEGAYTTLQANSATWGAALSAGEVLLAQISNADSVTLNRGDVVYSFGATGNVMSVKKASNSSEARSSKTLGIVNGTIIPNGIGYVTIAGRIDKLNLGAFNEGDALWLDSTAGNFTNVKAVAPNHLVYLGVVERANGGNGIAYIKVQNGYELNEIHDVLINGVQAGDVLQRNSTNTLWINAPLSADKWNSAYTNVNSNSAAWSAVTSYSTLIGDNVTNPLTAAHNLNTKDIIFSVREVTTNKLIQAAGRTVDNNSLELTFNSTPTVNQYDITVLCNGGIAGTSNGTTNTFALTTITSSTYIQNVSYTHNLYSDSIASGQILVYLLPPANHISVTQHKKIGSTASVVLSAPNGATIDGQPTYTLTNQYEGIGLYSDGTNYFIQ